MKALVIDDEPGIVYAFERYFKGRGDECRSASTAERGLEILGSERPDVIILDVRLPGMNGLTAVERIREKDPETPILVITAHGTLDTAVRATKLGAFDYLTKPIDVRRLDEILDRALGRTRASPRVEKLRREAGTLCGVDGIVGRSPEMQDVFKQVGLVCRTDASVLIEGESGVGKELVARSIHAHSTRATQPFEAINCACIPETLVESELFGHEKGAFTGAVDRKVGKFEMAHRGTIFLDEVSELPLGAQAKLLRAIEERAFARLGSTTPTKVDVRILCATNTRLQERVEEGRFREDLFYRLSVFRIRVPPLRRRLDDLPLLAAFFLERLGSKGITEAALRRLETFSWPGNVRELRNTLERAHILSRGEVIREEHLPEEICRPQPSGRSIGERIDALVEDYLSENRSGRGGLLDRLTREVERSLLEKVLRRVKGNQLRAARLLGIHRLTLRRKLKQYGLYDRVKEKDV